MSLTQVIDWIKQGNVVVLHTTEACRIFHLQPIDLRKSNFKYVDCNQIPSLLAPGEWEAFVREQVPHVQELTSGPTRQAIIEQKQVVHRTYYAPW